MIAGDQGGLASARVHAEKARAIVGKITSSRSWIGAHAAVAIGAVLNGEGDPAGAEREFASAERSPISPPPRSVSSPHLVPAERRSDSAFTWVNGRWQLSIDMCAS
jgi:hypothetical protein